MTCLPRSYGICQLPKPVSTDTGVLPCAYLAGKRDAQQSIANLRKRIRDLEDNSPADEP